MVQMPTVTEVMRLIATERPDNPLRVLADHLPISAAKVRAVRQLWT